VAAGVSSKIDTLGTRVSGADAVVPALMTDAADGGVASPPPQAVTSNDVATAVAVSAKSFGMRFMVSS
jgi:hypothetical protein